MRRVDPVPYQHDDLMMPTLKNRPGWRRDLKQQLLSRDTTCQACGKELSGAIDLHHAIITKGDIVGWPKRWKVLIDTPLNCFLLHHSCHIDGIVPSREFFWKLSCEFYTEQVVTDWVVSLPFKHIPLQGWIEFTYGRITALDKQE